jgi:CRP-like cAMP-binding protein
MPKTPAPDPSESVSFENGAFIYKEGDNSRDLYLIQQGEVELLDSGAKRVVTRLTSGEFFGELSALEEKPRDFGARAGSACTLLKIDPAALAGLLRDPEVAAQMIRRLSLRLRAALAPRDEEGGTRPVSTVSRPAAAGEAAASTPALVKPRFVHGKTGTEFPLPPAGEALVGRADPKSGFKPEIELSVVDTDRSLSRRHARILIRDNEVMVSEEARVANGTFVNGQRLKAGVPAKIKDGDQVRFGLVETVFRVG